MPERKLTQNEILAALQLTLEFHRTKFTSEFMAGLQRGLHTRKWLGRLESLIVAYGEYIQKPSAMNLAHLARYYGAINAAPSPEEAAVDLYTMGSVLILISRMWSSVTTPLKNIVLDLPPEIETPQNYL